MWLLPVLLLALTVLAMGMQRRATRQFGGIACWHSRPNHSLSVHPAARHSR